VISLMEALRRMTLMPAQRLEASVPAMRNKGRIKVGADADLVAFGADRVIDKATFENPAQYSEGIEHVMVDGVFVVSGGSFVKGVYPGAGLRTK
jgi:N-acyl-D-glutamate deacylase